MAYKDKDKQKAANRQAAQRRRNKAKGMTIVIPEAIVIPENVIPNSHTLPANYGQVDCECKQCIINRRKGSKHLINHGPYKDISQLDDNEINRVSLPGDVDYEDKAGLAICCECCEAIA